MISISRRLLTAIAGGGLLLTALPAAAAPRPSILLITIDTLRADRVSAYGYDRKTTPHLDEELAAGVLVPQARTEEPLTGPSMVTLLTSLPPHEHGATRNGLRMREGLPSLPKALARRGYRTAAMVANWTLRDELTGLGEHFETYQEVLTRNRWFGLFREEAGAARVTDAALAWAGPQLRREPRRPVLLWAHYVDPHAPYDVQESVLEQLGYPGHGLDRARRYDTEVAFADREIGRLLRELRAFDGKRSWLIVFTADHGESLGEHGYWGHGRNTFEPNLHIPFGIQWVGRLQPRRLDLPLVLADVAPTVLDLVGVDGAQRLAGRSWAPELRGRRPAPAERVTIHQAHRGAVLSQQDSVDARSNGLLEVARIDGSVKEILRPRSGDCLRFDLSADPGELRSLAGEEAPCSTALREQADLIQAGLERSDRLPPPSLGAEDIEHLRALGYLD